MRKDESVGGWPRRPREPPTRPDGRLADGFRRVFPRRLFAKLPETSPKLAMDVAAAALPAFVALWLLSPWPLLGSVHGQFSAGGCTFDDGPAACDYHQDLYDDFEWVHVSAQEPHYLPPEMPQGSYMVVDASNHDPGEKARLQLPTMKETDPKCRWWNSVKLNKKESRG